MFFWLEPQIGKELKEWVRWHLCKVGVGFSDAHDITKPNGTPGGTYINKDEFAFYDVTVTNNAELAIDDLIVQITVDPTNMGNFHDSVGSNNYYSTYDWYIPTLEPGQSEEFMVCFHAHAFEGSFRLRGQVFGEIVPFSKCSWYRVKSDEIKPTYE